MSNSVIHNSAQRGNSEKLNLNNKYVFIRNGDLKVKMNITLQEEITQISIKIIDYLTLCNPFEKKDEMIKILNLNLDNKISIEGFMILPDGSKQDLDEKWIWDKEYIMNINNIDFLGFYGLIVEIVDSNETTETETELETSTQMTDYDTEKNEN